MKVWLACATSSYAFPDYPSSLMGSVVEGHIIINTMIIIIIGNNINKIVIIGRAHQQNIDIRVLVDYLFVGLVIFVITIAIFIFQVLFGITLRIKPSSSDEN